MKKILFSILAVAAFAFTASAQDTGFGYGVKAGINIANLTNSDGNYKVGFTGGIFADYRFSNLFALSAFPQESTANTAEYMLWKRTT